MNTGITLVVSPQLYNDAIVPGDRKNKDVSKTPPPPYTCQRHPPSYDVSMEIGVIASPLRYDKGEIFEVIELGNVLYELPLFRLDSETGLISEKLPLLSQGGSFDMAIPWEGDFYDANTISHSRSATNMTELLRQNGPVSDRMSLPPTKLLASSGPKGRRRNRRSNSSSSNQTRGNSNNSTTGSTHRKRLLHKLKSSLIRAISLHY
ncbi:hypothetical protein H4219_000485 [Mycoemilia scoparia]|uniref:Uncharacterized protein n=1 Tax=Mycoemilia scoparia TaxID=417184 RepID=A0A9W8A2X4_9FUNG|nr:hypothetical protein H4219_000485 [Mycoemilia scoparia]